jgi:hypothetical protein
MARHVFLLAAARAMAAIFATGGHSTAAAA